MRYPPRLGHLATRAVVISKLLPTYANAHQIDDDEAHARLERAIAGRVYEDVLAASWEALLGGTKRLDEEGLLEKVAGALKDRPLRRGKVAQPNPQWSAFMLQLDLEAGTATEAARRVFETDAAQAMLKKGLAEVGAFLAKELTRK